MTKKNSEFRIQNSESGSKSSQSSTAGSAMAKLLANQAARVNAFHKGNQVKGTITKITRSEILVDIQGKTEAVVLEKDKKLLVALLSLLHVGDVVTVTILNPESDMGNPVVSLRRFLEEHAWNKLAQTVKNQETIECVVSEMTKGGYVLSMPYGLSGFLPHSHAQTSTQLTVGKKIPVSIIDLNKADKKIILSQKRFLTKEEFDTLKKQLGIGNTVDATVTNVTSFGIFVSLPQQLDGFIHVSEVAWESTTDPTAQFSIGQTISAKIIGFDTEAKRVTLSIKRLTADPFTQIAERFPVEKQIQGVTIRLIKGNVYIDLGDGIEGVIPKEKVPPTIVYKVDDKIVATVSEVDMRKRRIVLTPVLKDKPIGYR